MAQPDPPAFPGFDLQRFMGMWSRFFQGPEQAMRVYRELLGLESDSRERSVEFLAQAARTAGVSAMPLFEILLRWGPTDAARVSAALYLASEGREGVVLEVLESLQPPLMTLTLVKGLADAIATRSVPPSVVDRLIVFGKRFEDDTHYTTVLLGDFTGRDLKRIIRRAIAEMLVRRDAPDAVDWPRD